MFKAAKFRFVFACLRLVHVYPGKILSFAHPRKKKLSPHEKFQVTDDLRLVGHYGWTKVDISWAKKWYLVSSSSSTQLHRVFFKHSVLFFPPLTPCISRSPFCRHFFTSRLSCQFVLRAKYRTPAHVVPTSLYYVYSILLVAWFYIFHCIRSKLLNSQTRVKIPKAGTVRNKFFVVRFARKKYGLKFDPSKRHGEPEVSSGLKKRGKNSINTETSLQTQILLMDLFISALFHWLHPVAQG